MRVPDERDSCPLGGSSCISQAELDLGPCVASERWRAGIITFEEQRRRRLLRVLPALGVDVDESPRQLDALFAKYLTSYRGAWRTFPDVFGLLRSLRRE